MPSMTSNHGAEQPTFADFALSQAVQRALDAMGFVFPSMIQKKAIPLAVYGNDVLGQAKSGTGKTAVFGIAAVELVLSKQPTPKPGESDAIRAQMPQVLMLAPTREIAVQIQCVVEQLAAYCEQLVVQSCIGGLSIADDMKRLTQGCHVVVGTPGRIKSLIEQNVLVTRRIRLLVLDEADKLLMDDFHEDIVAIASALPTRRQTLAFSATFTPQLLDRTARLMRNPQLVRVQGPNEATVEMLSSDSAQSAKSASQREPTELWLRRVRQFYRIVPPLSHENASSVRSHLDRLKRKIHQLAQLLSQMHFQQCIVFCNDKLSAQALGDALSHQQWPALVITSAQSQSQRLDTMQRFRDFQARILVSTDLTARGIDVHKVDFVINMELPRDPATYLHRIGRTGRFGGAGVAISLTIDEETQAILQLAQVFRMPMSELCDPVPSDLVASSVRDGDQKPWTPHQERTPPLEQVDEEREEEEEGDVPRPVTCQRQLEAQQAYQYNTNKVYRYPRDSLTLCASPQSTRTWLLEEACYKVWVSNLKNGTGPGCD